MNWAFGLFRGNGCLAGYVDARTRAGRPTDMVMRYGRRPVTFNHGAESQSDLLARHDDVDAVFAVSDLSAVGAPMECQQRGIRVPDDMAIAGFGNFEIGAQTNHALTTIRVADIGIDAQAGNLLLDFSNEKATLSGPGPQVVDLAMRVERQSTSGK